METLTDTRPGSLVRKQCRHDPANQLGLSPRVAVCTRCGAVKRPVLLPQAVQRLALAVTRKAV